MSRLEALRNQITRLHRRRRAARVTVGLCAVALAVAWVLVGLFLIDWSLELTRLQRVVALVAAAAVVAWAVRRYAWPWLTERESELDVALLVEKERDIDSDLVAAIEFELPQAAGWGSVALEEAVITEVATFSKGWNLLEGFRQPQMARRLALAGVSAALLVVFALAMPGTTAIFFKRLLLSSAHYPTRTRIERVVVNGSALEALLPADQVSGSYPYGQPLRFAVVCSGELPADGRVELRTVKSGLETTVALAKPATKDAAAAGGTAGDKAGSSDVKLEEGQMAYQGALPRLVDSLYVQLYLGDAWTDPVQLEVIPLPAIETRLRVTSPDYAQSAAAPPKSASTRQLSVVEGSRIDMEVLCTNGKRLVDVWMTIDNKRYRLKQTDNAGQAWAVDTTATPLARLEGPVSYRIDAVDEHGLAPQRPIVGSIRIQTDRPPQVSGSLVTNYVLPSAQPTISIRAADDFGLAQVRMHVEVQREGAEGMQEQTLDIVRPAAPILGEKLPLRHNYKLDLNQFKLVKGDRVRLTLEAIDFRGPGAPGRSTRSDTLVLNVTDESGVLSAISESDERSARQLDAIIRRQLGIGAAP